MNGYLMEFVGKILLFGGFFVAVISQIDNKIGFSSMLNILDFHE